MTSTRLGTLDNYDITTATHYCEPGYTSDTPRGIVFADWNDRYHYDRDTNERILTDDRPSRLARVLERCGYESEWCDEWTTCVECGGAFRTTADSYSWSMWGYYYDGCEPVCGDCVTADPEPYIEQLTNNPDAANTILPESYFTEAGWDRVPPDHEYANGWYPGQTDDPHAIYEQYRDTHDVVFSITEASQFYVTFVAYIRPHDIDTLDD